MIVSGTSIRYKTNARSPATVSAYSESEPSESPPEIKSQKYIIYLVPFCQNFYYMPLHEVSGSYYSPLFYDLCFN